ncbi:MAG: family 10 glycosylhydrolase, partial [Sodaliphilus sp.]|nr:family 10 glycosylhydrolase [Bacteroidales bacterium]MDY5706706.1 family 10 glycosylhydrolase [Sodaliphilus sp.]
MALALLALTCFVGSNSVNAADGYAQKREMRSVWIATVFNIDWPKANHYGNPDLMKADLIAYFDACKTANLNSVCFQVRPMCDAFYKSSYEPWSSYLSGSRGTNPGWDPLAFAVQEAHKRGLRIDAWVNPYRYSKTPEQPWAGESWSNAKDAEARKHLLTYGGVSILDPAQKWTIDRIVNVCVEIITKYDVDGLVFDDYFYPDKIPTTNTAGDYKEWQNSGTSMNIGDWRRDNVNRMVKAVYAAVQQHRPDCSFGISPAGVSCSDAAVAKKHGVEQITCASDWQYNGIFSDPVQWLEDKSIDYISPQIYWSTTNPLAPYIPLTQWWSKVAYQFGRHHYASHYNTSESVLTPGNTASYIQMQDQISANRSNTLNNAPGSIFFSAKCLKEGSWGSTFANYVKQNIYTHKAIPPAMTWKAKANYKKPENLAKNGKQLSWDAVSNDKMCRYAIYAVPKSTSMPYASTAQNGINSEHLVDVTYTNSYELPADKADNYWYAVTALDAANNEYEAATLGEPVFTGTKLELNTTEHTQMSASYDATSGEYTLNTTGNDPFIFTKALASDLASSLCVVEFDYTSSADIDNLQIFLGNIWSESRSKSFGAMNATSSYKSFKAIITNERNSLSWGKTGEELRLDFGSQSGITIKVKNLRVREMTAAEKENYEYKEDATGDLAGLGYFFKKGENGLWYFHSANITSIAYRNRDFVVLKSFDSNYTKYEGIKDNYFIEWILTKSGSRVWYTRVQNSSNAKLPFWPSIINGEFPDGYPSGATSFNGVFDISTGFKALASTYPFKLVLLPVDADNGFSPKGLNEFTEIKNLGTYGVETKTSEVSDGHPLYTFSGVSDITGIGYYTDIKKLNMSRERFGFNAKGT